MFINEFIPIKGPNVIGTNVKKMMEYATKEKMVKKLEDGFTKTDNKTGL